MKKILLFALTIPFGSMGQEVVSSQGNSYTNSIGSIDFTIGEVVIKTESSAGIQLTQGFHQTNWNFLGILDNNPNISISVYPNPTSDELNVEVAEYNNLQYEMYDVNGRLVLKGILSGNITKIETRELLPASYSLVIQDNKFENLKTFKLIKTQ